MENRSLDLGTQRCFPMLTCHWHMGFMEWRLTLNFRMFHIISKRNWVSLWAGFQLQSELESESSVLSYWLGSARPFGVRSPPGTRSWNIWVLARPQGTGSWNDRVLASPQGTTSSNYLVLASPKGTNPWNDWIVERNRVPRDRVRVRGINTKPLTRA